MPLALGYPRAVDECDEAKRANECLQESEARLSAKAEHSIGKYLSQ